jgi:hypothetical protein
MDRIPGGISHIEGLTPFPGPLRRIPGEFLEPTVNNQAYHKSKFLSPECHWKLDNRENELPPSNSVVYYFISSFSAKAPVVDRVCTILRKRIIVNV